MVWLCQEDPAGTRASNCPATTRFGGEGQPPGVFSLFRPVEAWAPPGAHSPWPRSVRLHPRSVGVVAIPSLMSPTMMLIPPIRPGIQKRTTTSSVVWQSLRTLVPCLPSACLVPPGIPAGLIGICVRASWPNPCEGLVLILVLDLVLLWSLPGFLQVGAPTFAFSLLRSRGREVLVGLLTLGMGQPNHGRRSRRRSPDPPLVRPVIFP